MVAFAKEIGVIDSKASFMAIDGLHYAEIDNGIVKLQMQDVTKLENHNSHVFLDTGSPHHVELTENVSELDVVREGAMIRYGKPYNEEGSNVNFVEI